MTPEEIAKLNSIEPTKESPKQKADAKKRYEEMLQEAKHYEYDPNPLGETKIRPEIIEGKDYKFRDNALYFVKTYPVFFDEQMMWWQWNPKHTKWEMTDETNILNLYNQTQEYNPDITIKRRTPIIESIRQVSRQHRPKPFPNHWIQFKNQIYNLQTETTTPATPEYFCTNPIPHPIGTSLEMPHIDKMLEEWVGEYKIDLYELIAYCTYPQYPIQTAISLTGGGANGKTSCLRLITKFLGVENVTSSSLTKLTQNRFETFNLYKKLACLMGETNFSEIDNTEVFKSLTGGEMITYEAKNKMPLQAYNYAKIIIASNSLPASNDTSDGFWRRWHLIDFPNQFAEGKDILDQIPEEEYANLALKVTKIIQALLERGKFTHQGTIEERRTKYIDASNPLNKFMIEMCEVGQDHYEKYYNVFNTYKRWLAKNKKRQVSYKEFSDRLNQEGFNVDKTSRGGEVDRYILGLKLRLIREEEYVTCTSEILRSIAMDIKQFIEAHPQNNSELISMKYNPTIIQMMAKQKILERNGNTYQINILPPQHEGDGA